MPSALEGTKTKVGLTYPFGAQNEIKCDTKGELIVNVVKMFNNEQDRNFITYGRVIQGTLKEG